MLVTVVLQQGFKTRLNKDTSNVSGGNEGLECDHLLKTLVDFFMCDTY